MFTKLYKKVQRIEDKKLNKAAKENVILVVRHKQKGYGGTFIKCLENIVLFLVKVKLFQVLWTLA